MTKKPKPSAFKIQAWQVLLGVSLLLVTILLLYKLGSITKSLAKPEIAIATGVYGWHGLIHNFFYWPIDFFRSIDFKLFPSHGKFLSRLPSTIFGLISMIFFGWLIYLWQGKRTALLSTPLFITSAWVLHVSRLATNDVVYLWAIVSLLLVHALTSKYPKSSKVWLMFAAIIGLIITIPGMIWLIILELYWQSDLLKKCPRYLKAVWQKILYYVLYLIWLPLLIINLRSLSHIKLWLGLPLKFPTITTLLKNWLGVFVHLLVRGPMYPYIWLAKAPLLDIFCLIMTLIGIYYYASHYKSDRSQYLGAIVIIGSLLIALGGLVGLSLLVPLLYVFAAMGISYLLHNWFKVFPHNPYARRFGLGLLVIAIALSCLYNLRAYFIAWPYNQTTIKTFNLKQKP